MKLRIYSDVILSIVTKVRDLFRDKSRQLLVTIFIVTLGAIVVLGCCHARTKRNEAAALGISSELHKQMMRENPLYRHIMEESDYRTDTQQFLERIKRKRQPKELQDWARDQLLWIPSRARNRLRVLRWTKLVRESRVPRLTFRSRPTMFSIKALSRSTVDAPPRRLASQGSS